MKEADTQASRTGFTLVELLVVISIIALLAAFLIPVAFRAIAAAKEAAIAVEIGEIAKAIQRFKTEYGIYPSDFTLASAADGQQAEQLLMRNFRNRNPVQDRPYDPSTGQPAAWDTFTLDPAEALFFWLGGSPPDPTKQGPGGFCKNPLKPKFGTGDRTPIYDFDKSRLVDNDGDGFLEYLPKGVNKPYVYLVSTNYPQAIQSTLPITSTSTDVVRPYLSKFNGTPVQQDFVESSSFQIICAGLDNEFGPANDASQPNLYPSGPYNDLHNDNITNFSAGTLESKLP